MSSLAHNFVDANRRLCDAISRRLPQAQARIFVAYEETVSDYVNRKPNQIIVDVGGGARCGFARRCISSARIIAADIAPAELARNRDTEERVACDARQPMPFADASVDIVVSHCVIEHMNDLDGFLAETWRILKSDGISIHLFPARNAPFSLINRMLPHRWSRALLYWLQPSQRTIGGFRAYYKCCSPRLFARVLRKHRFEAETTRLSYFQSDYFSFFVPLFLASAVYELLAQTLGLHPLCAFVLSVARKPSAVSECASALTSQTCSSRGGTLTVAS